MLKNKRGASYRTIYKILCSMNELDSDGGFSEMHKACTVLVLIALSNAISERGFSLMNHVMTKKKARLDMGLDPKMRVVSLAPSDDDGITSLVDRATCMVFGSATPARAAGAAAANVVRAAKKAKLQHGALSAGKIIAGAKNAGVADDGTSLRTIVSLVPFPVEYDADVLMPVARDKSLKGQQLLYVYDDNKGDGLQWHKFNVTKAKKPSRVDATGAELTAPLFKFTLQKGKKGVSFKTKLPVEQYGAGGKWIIAKKKG
jgi:hypothetical protein